MARSFQVPGVVEADDMYSEGIVGFLTAIRKFDPGRGIRLWTYAKWWVWNHMIELLCKQLNLSEEARRQYKRIMDTRERLWYAQQRDPTAEEVANASEVPLAIVQEVLQSWTGRTVPLLDVIRKEDETGKRSRGVVLPSTETAEDEASRKAGDLDDLPGFQTALTLGSDRGTKWIILHLLHTYEVESKSYTWDEIITLLKCPKASFASAWSDLCQQFSLPVVIPRNWSAICTLFQKPPPLLTVVALSQTHRRGLSDIQKNLSR